MLTRAVFFQANDQIEKFGKCYGTCLLKKKQVKIKTDRQCYHSTQFQKSITKRIGIRHGGKGEAAPKKV